MHTPSVKATVALLEFGSIKFSRKKLKKCIDWSKIGKEDYLSAMERSPINDLKIKTLLNTALTSDIDNREVYMKGIQSPYEYEEQSEYDIHKILD